MTKEEQVIDAVKNGEIPQYLYKYRVTDPTRSYFDNIITQRAMMFSSPSDFNDPFDCQLQPQTHQTPDEIREFFNRIMAGKPKHVIDNYVSHAIAKPEELADVLQTAFDFNSYGVLCLSRQPDNILLWSHYADYHKGVCLEFNILEDPGFFWATLQVNYSNVYPIYNHMSAAGQIVTVMIKTKFEQWEYENEFRVIKSRKGLYHFAPKALSRVIFGLTTPPTEIDRIQSLVTDNGLDHIRFAHTVKGDRQYILNVQPL